mmetsp:Transcript_55057/g.61567  ORF Transcript_55057/g.61567 Transcript_55057/m.61567 type:complete len:307 (+) Transcript_55057:171-1091(+)|eukprot:CAMPEP_0170801810 /NCGR_PEP_ID=MMETSP0733-20121128/28801_1 /TAXON_ID=186038 /ORGANISM="Fragilariopsis kerguelensis, Strain L26-C5" /LENGTH=306 /DNA_ID=CAMNT_0011154681 /DNA_START=206 /DNA_END=1126 /DNA_ORIENTATION=-
MPCKKNKGKCTGFPKKDSDPRTLQSSAIKAKKQRQQEQQKSLVSISSPVKNHPNPKKSLPVRENISSKKKAPVQSLLEDSLEGKRDNIIPVVTATKRKSKSSEEKDSTESESSGFQAEKSTISSTSTTTNLSSMAGSRLDAKLEYLLSHYVLPIDDNHEIQQMFTENDFYQFKEFTRCDKQSFLENKRKKGNVTVGFKDQKIKFIHDVRLYYKFVRENGDKIMVENPDQWIEEDFEEWLDKERHPSNAVYTGSQASNTTTTSTTPVIVSVTTKQKMHGWAGNVVCRIQLCTLFWKTIASILNGSSK